MSTIDLMDQFSHLGEGGIRNNGTLDAEVQFQPALRTMRTDFIQVKTGDSIVYKNMNGMSSTWNILSFYTGDAQGYYASGIAGQTTPQSGVWTAAQDGYVRLFGSFPSGDNISVTMTDLAPDVEDYLAQYDAMNYRFLPNSIPKIVAHIQEYLSNHPIADSTTLQAVIDAAFQSYMEEIQQTADTYIAEAVPPAAAAAVDAAASPALQEITAKAAEAAESARQAGLSQQSAEMSEENALTYRNQAQQIKDSISAEVASSVLAAQEQATLAQESAQAADESADTAEQFVAQARAQAEAAADQAQNASGYASDAQGYMQDASGFAQNASDFADNAAQSAATFSTDPTLTISGKAADAKATGDELSALKSALEANDKIIYTPSTYDPTLSGYKVLISSSTGKWVSNSNYSCGIGNIPHGANKVIVTANNSNQTRIAFLTTTAHAHNTTPDYATGWTETDLIPAGETKTYVIPDDALYLYYLKGADNLDYTPGSIEYLSDAIAPTQESVEALQESVEALTDALTITTTIDPETASNYTGFITASNVWYVTSATRRCGIISIPDGIEKIHVKANAQYTSAFAFLSTNSHVNGQAPDYATGWTNVDTLSAGAEKTYIVPSDGKYLYYTRMFDGGDRLPQSIDYLKTFSADDGTTVIPLGLHEMPRNESALNIVKRCRQMTDIKWTPAVDLYRYMLVQSGGVIPDTAESQNYFGTFKAGTEYTGIPYGRVAGVMSDYGYDYATVAHYIPLETFVSSVSNADSKLCKEDVHSLGNHRSVLYATVCSGLTCYALDVPEVPTASIGNISGLTLVGKVNDNGVLLDDSNFKIGDVLNKYDYHTAIITDIIRDDEGVLQYIELSDASTAGLADRNYADGQIGGLCRRKGWTRDQLYNVGAWGDYNLYRYSGTVPYTPNPYVNIGDEFNMQRIEHFPCMPYEGNKFTYKTDYIPNNAIKVLISLSGYSYLKVFKDGTEISGSPFAVTNETASIDVSEISAGVYTAYLCNITDGNVVNLTYPCEWTISDA